ncbi:hypothetical protein RND71_026550 [Anisodus tanguticus]|uniref:Uncharacterized protein n=1 Tax=Anisodus tanguticus TaxID=243964 RepID=A0AAE1V8F0_9SOLA|nr:hypothetical protein RND71_026550 [Anisodus tanguticus]
MEELLLVPLHVISADRLTKILPSPTHNTGTAALERVYKAAPQRHNANTFVEIERFLPLQRRSSMVERRCASVFSETERFLQMQCCDSMVERRSANTFAEAERLLPQWRRGPHLEPPPPKYWLSGRDIIMSNHLGRNLVALRIGAPTAKILAKWEGHNYEKPVRIMRPKFIYVVLDKMSLVLRNYVPMYNLVEDNYYNRGDNINQKITAYVLGGKSKFRKSQSRNQLAGECDERGLVLRFEQSHDESHNETLRYSRCISYNIVTSSFLREFNVAVSTTTFPLDRHNLIIFKPSTEDHNREETTTGSFKRTEIATKKNQETIARPSMTNAILKPRRGSIIAVRPPPQGTNQVLQPKRRASIATLRPEFSMSNFNNSAARPRNDCFVADISSGKYSFAGEITYWYEQ